MFSDNIKKLREEAGLTQDEFAEKIFVTRTAVSKWENGNCMPDSGIIVALCEILNITINDLFSGEVVDMKEKSMGELFKEFYTFSKGVDPKGPLMDLFLEIISEEGESIDETN